MSAPAWLRLHRSLLNCHKVQSLPDPIFKTWVNLLCVADEDGLLPNINAISFALRAPVAICKDQITSLIDARLVDAYEDCLKMHDWNDHQFRSDSSTERVQAFRKRQRNVSVTPPETDTETDTEKNTSSLRSEVQKPSKPKATRIPADFSPDLAEAERLGLSRQAAEQEAAAFADYWRAKPVNATKLDWPATWRNWVRKSLKDHNRGDNHGQRRPQPGSQESPTRVALRIARGGGP